MGKYKISVISAVYNLEKYLPRCLDSLVNQTLQDIEIICVDDGSTDSAPKIIDEYAQKYPQKVKSFHKQNGGEFTTRNYGLERATGEYVTFIDTDDYVEPNWAEKLYNAAKENNADMAVCGFERIDLNTGKVVSTNMTHFGKCVKEINNEDDFMSPWSITSSDKRFEMLFEPLIDRAACTDIKIIKSDQHQVFGYYTGDVILDDGTNIHIDRLLGFCEKVENKW